MVVEGIRTSSVCPRRTSVDLSTKKRSILIRERSAVVRKNPNLVYTIPFIEGTSPSSCAIALAFFIFTSRYINKVHILNPSSLLEFFLFVCSKIGLCCLLIYSHFITNSESPLKTSLHIRNAIASSIAMSKVSYSARLFVQGKQRRYERRWTWAERLRDPCSGAINLHRSIEVKLPRGFGDANKILIFVQKLISEV